MIGNKGNSYTLLKLVTKTEFTTNILRVVSFYFDTYRVDPQSVAAHISNEHIVDGVLIKLKSFLFKVRWLGYDASHDN